MKSRILSEDASEFKIMEILKKYEVMETPESKLLEPVASLTHHINVAGEAVRQRLLELNGDTLKDVLTDIFGFECTKQYGPGLTLASLLPHFLQYRLATPRSLSTILRATS